MRKIVHIDMDCFYAQVEMRDKPALYGRPIAVGGSPDGRGVLCTANYEARKYGVHSAMSTRNALRLCPSLILLPVDMAKYKAVSQEISALFLQYTTQIEPLSLDEAYLDVTDCQLFQNSAFYIAQDLRAQIYKKLKLTASCGIAPNKLLAKIASDWNKPNGQTLVAPSCIDDFVADMPVKKLPGVGKKMEERLFAAGISTCKDIRAQALKTLTEHFGQMGAKLYEYARGIDKREVISLRERKSISVEHTFHEDLNGDTDFPSVLQGLYDELLKRWSRNDKPLPSKAFVKIKFNNFQQTTIEQSVIDLDFQDFSDLFHKAKARQDIDIRLIGLGVRLHSSEYTKQLPLRFD